MKRIAVIALIAMPLLLALSYPTRNATHGLGVVLGTIGWLGFLLSVLIVIIAGSVLGVRAMRTRRAVS